MSSYTFSGKLIEKYPVQQITDTFKKREFVLEAMKEFNGNTYSDFIKFQLTQDKCSLLDSIETGANLKVSFNLRGNKWNKKDGTVGYITSLDAWRIDLDNQVVSAPSGQQGGATTSGGTEIMDMPLGDDGGDDLPF